MCHPVLLCNVCFGVNGRFETTWMAEWSPCTCSNYIFLNFYQPWESQANAQVIFLARNWSRNFSLEFSPGWRCQRSGHPWTLPTPVPDMLLEINSQHEREVQGEGKVTQPPEVHPLLGSVSLPHLWKWIRNAIQLRKILFKLSTWKPSWVLAWDLLE